MTKLFFILIFLTSIAYCQNTNSINKLDESYIPPNTIKLNDSLYIDKTPVSNIMYLEFEENVKRMWNISLHNAMKGLPKYNLDESTLEKYYTPHENIQLFNEVSRDKNSKIVKGITSYNYMNHPKFYHNPVLNISHKQAALYCFWRTDMVQLGWALKSKNNEQLKKYPQRLKYRLPTKKELEIAKQSFNNAELLKITNEKNPGSMKIEFTGNNYYIHNLSEFTDDFKVYGENWLKKKPDLSKNNYTTFRCICEVER